VLIALVGFAVAIVALLIGVIVGRRHGGGPARRVDSAPARNTLPDQVVHALSHGVVVVDRDERVVLVNPAAKALGVLASGRLVFDQLAELVRAAMDTGVRVNDATDLPMDRLGREPIALSVSAVPLPDPDGRTAYVVLLLDDVSERRRLEAVRRDFVANVSHELSTPVGALSLLAEAVQEAADDPQSVNRFAGRMQHEAIRLGRLVRELIELSRLQGAEPLPGSVEVPVETVVAEAVDRTRLIAERADVNIAVRTEPDLWVRGNETHLITAVANLLDNAVAYSPSGTRIAVSARGGVDETSSGDVVEISVSDQGIGIAEVDLARIFERFYRVDPARSRATGGTGLGLSIVKHVATNHGGSVSVWSVEGEGSTFTIRLPRVHSRRGSSAVDDAAVQYVRGSA
jgi:two-component system, OmpR family, sensor histidine kinase SenX3